MTHPSKVKGNAYERELVNQAKDSGLEAIRAWGSDGRSIGHTEGVDVLLDGKRRVQAKRMRKLPVWCIKLVSYLLTCEADAVVFRGDGGESFVLLTWWEYLDLVKEANAGRNPSQHPPGDS